MARDDRFIASVALKGAGGLDAQGKSEGRKGTEDRSRYRPPRPQGATGVDRIRYSDDVRRDRVCDFQRRTVR